MLSVDKDTKNVDDKKDAMVTTSLSKKKLLTNQKVTTSAAVKKGNKTLDDMKEAMVTIRGKCSYNFEGQSKGYTGWFNLDCEVLKRKFSTLEPDFYGKCFEKYIEGQDMEQYKTFFGLFDSTKLNLFNINYPVKNRSSSSDKKIEAKQKVVAPICGKIALSKESINTQNVTNGTNLIIESEAPAPEVIVVKKLRTDIYVLSGAMGETSSGLTRKKRASIKAVKRIPKKEPIPNQD